MGRTVRCESEGCGQAGIVRDVPDVPVARGLVHRPPLLCAECGAPISDHIGERPQANVEKAVRTPPETTARRGSGPKSRRS